jgi:hypothetical protein
VSIKGFQHGGGRGNLGVGKVSQKRQGHDASGCTFIYDHPKYVGTVLQHMYLESDIVWKLGHSHCLGQNL